MEDGGTAHPFFTKQLVLAIAITKKVLRQIELINKNDPSLKSF